MTSEHRHARKDASHEFPDLKSPNYFYGQMLGVREFRGEQSYFREKLKLLNRTLHGYGVICGLTVSATPMADDCGPSDEKDDCVPAPRPTLRVACGMALDCDGNELVLHRHVDLDPLDHLTKEQRDACAVAPLMLYVTICYCAKPIEPSRPLQTQECGITSDCEYGWTLDTVRLRVSTEKPEDRQDCEPCCTSCSGCLLLAVIDGFEPGKPIRAAQIDNGARRMLAVYDFARISGINWIHGAAYTREQARQILGGLEDDDETHTGGLRFELTRPVRTSSLQPGVIDIHVLEGGDGKAGNVAHIEGEFVNGSDPYTRTIAYRQRGGELLQKGDRVVITMHCEYVLDACCRAIDGVNLGGRIPVISGSIEPEYCRPPRDCVEPTGYPPPWRSGNHTEGSTFVSWFFIRHEEKGKKKEHKS